MNAPDVDSLQSDLIRLTILAQIKPGQIISIDDCDQWSIVESSPWRSGLRKFVAFITGNTSQPQRRLFIASAQKTIRRITSHVFMIMKTSIFARIVDPQGSLSLARVQAINNASDMEEMESMFVTFTTVVGHLWEALKGLQVMKSNPPYHDDPAFVSTTQIALINEIQNFLNVVHRRAGAEYESRIFPFLSSSFSSSSSSVKPSTSTSTPDAKEGKQYSQPPSQQQWQPSPSPSPAPAANNNKSNLPTPNTTTGPTNLPTPNNTSSGPTNVTNSFNPSNPLSSIPNQPFNPNVAAAAGTAATATATANAIPRSGSSASMTSIAKKS